jgi:hypothetical protein
MAEKCATKILIQHPTLQKNFSRFKMQLMYYSTGGGVCENY